MRLLKSVIFDTTSSSCGCRPTIGSAPFPAWMVALRAASSTSNHWPSRFVESHGNYQDEVFLERYDASLYKHQRELPRLPVPTLDQTVQRFLPTALPLAETEEEARTLQVACEEFLDEARPLQERLLQRQADLQDTSWLQQWWNEQAYLQFRDPVVVHVSYFFQLADDPTTHVGTERAAAILCAAAQYRQKVCSGDLPQDTIGKQKTPLCSVAYKYMFHACRIPQPGQDCYRIYDPSLSVHAAVACRNQFFAVPLFDNDGNLLSLSAMQQNLMECQARAQDKTAPSKPALDLGWLTTWNRDDWARARAELLQIGGPAMQGALELLESSMLLVCLDEEEPVWYRQRAEEYLHGGSRSGGNRWFDKSIQLVVSKNGKAGLVGEHSMMDGMPAVGFCEYLKSQTYRTQLGFDKMSAPSTAAASTAPSTRGVVDIFEEAFSNLSEEAGNELKSFIGSAKRDFKSLVNDYEIQVESFQGYGSTFMKKAGFSPDAYVQMAIQLATYRLFGGKQVGTYESTQVRPFLHGRTEVTRSVSVASHAFVEIMGIDAVDEETDEEMRKKKLDRFRKATASHVVYIRKAVQGLGVDRHFLGLSQLLEPGEESPALFSHSLYLLSKQWRVSTSTLPNQPGFGPVESNGVGIGYEIKPNSCIFTVTSRRENAFVDNLCHYLEEALVEIQSLLELDTPPQSKL